MSKCLGNFIEVVIPSTRMRDLRVEAALGYSVLELGGCTLTEGRGFYVREDNGKLDTEHVIVARWEFSDDDSAKARWATRRVVTQLLACGEESVLRRRYYSYAADKYKSELIFA